MYGCKVLPSLRYKSLVHGVTKVAGGAECEKPKGTRKSAGYEQRRILDGTRGAQVWSAADSRVLHGLLAIDLNNDCVNLKQAKGYLSVIV